MMVYSRRHRGDERNGLQKLISRSIFYVYFPLFILIFLAANFVWEVVRANVSQQALTSWPLRFTLLNPSTTAVLVGATATLLIGRMQWAHANRPALGFAIADEGFKFDPSSDMWHVWLYNAGPGIAQVEGLRYKVRFVNDSTSTPATLSEINHTLASRGLVDGDDYFIRWIGQGAPLAAAKNPAEGRRIASLSTAALAHIVELDIEITIIDGVGDRHRRNLLIIDSLPSIAKSAISQLRGERYGEGPSSCSSAVP
ncbi:hypothetical protein [Micromonospora sp. NPDC005979]|uniref:hypothetical protein n=1 Tax=Micromonospora sp. NPDC005979 TaxID=3156726 RepID=UPI0033B17AE7